MSMCFFQGKAAIPLLWKFFNKWANPDDTRKADPAAVAKLLTPLGLHQKRAQIIIRFSGKKMIIYFIMKKELSLLLYMYLVINLFCCNLY